jgi:hypothetical protein
MQNTETQLTASQKGLILTDDRIYRASTQQKIAEMDTMQLFEVGNRLLSWSKNLGISNVPSKDELAELMKFLIHNYGHKLTLQDIALAFEYAVTGKTSASVKHNHEFNIGFVAPILNAYVDLKAKELTRKKQNEPVKEIEMSKEQLEKSSMNSAINMFNYFKEKGHCLDFGSVTFLYLDRDLKVIPFTKEVRGKMLIDAKGLIESEAREKLKTEIDISVRSRLNATLQQAVDGSEMVKSKARQICLERFFKMLIEMNYSLGDYINENRK